MSVVIGIESPLQDDIRKLVAALNDHLLPLSPTEFQFGISVDDMAEPRTTVFVARRDGVALGIGALTVHDDGTGEVKRMYTVPEARGAKSAHGSSTRSLKPHAHVESHTCCSRPARRPISRAHIDCTSAPDSGVAARSTTIRTAAGPPSTSYRPAAPDSRTSVHRPDRWFRPHAGVGRAAAARLNASIAKLRSCRVCAADI